MPNHDIVNQENDMQTKREFLRVNSINLVYYSLMNDKGDILWEGVARTLNMSMGGVLIEINSPIDENARTLIMETALADKIIKLKGRVAFIKRTDDGMTELGVQFIETKDEDITDISEFIHMYDQDAGKTRNMLRENISSINNVVLTLSKEHKIINDYVIACRKMFEDDIYTIQNLETLFGLMEKDLCAHFQFEETILFQAAVSGAKNQGIADLVAVLKREHDTIREHLAMMISYIQSLARADKTIEKISKDKVDSFMQLIKTHSRNEMVQLFPLIDADPEKIRALNKLIPRDHRENT